MELNAVIEFKELKARDIIQHRASHSINHINDSHEYLINDQYR